MANSIGVIRKSMLLPPGHTSRIPIATAAAAEIKTMLGGRLGADSGRVA